MTTQNVYPYPETESQNDWHCTREHPRFQDGEISPEDLKRIHRFSSVPLRADQVYVRSMLVASNQPCDSDGCQFTRNALEQIAERIVGQSVLSGHNRASLPLARFFKADVISAGQNNGASQDGVRAWFYWLRDTSGSKDLLLNIDGGIYREVSLSWRFNRWHCSICHSENGQCSHQVGKTYQGKTCYRVIDSILDVLEGSLVYKGADSNTVLNRALNSTPVSVESVMLLSTFSSDPLLSFLDEQGLVHDRIRIREDDEMFHESIDRLWIRSDVPDVPSSMLPLLELDGVVLHETLTTERDSSSAMSLLSREGALVHPTPGRTEVPHE